MKILLLNPNTTGDVTDLLHAAGSKAASAGTELVPMTAMRGARAPHPSASRRPGPVAPA